MNGLFLILTIALGGVERGEASFQPTSAEADVPELFRLTAARFPYERELIRTEASYSVFAVRFPSPITTPDPENNTVHAEYFCPAGSVRRPAVVVLHILGADFALSRYLAARLAQRGVASLFVKLPYYGERRPAGTEKRFLSGDMDRSLLSMRQGVCDVRRATAWLAGRPEVDSKQLGVTGISLGGIVASLSAAIDPTIKQAALLLAGGDLARILWEMPEAEAAKYRDLWLKSGRTQADFKTMTTPFDPLTYAHRLIGKRLFMMAGNVDEVIPPASTKALWEAAGRPRIEWFDCGHYSAVGFLLPAIRETVDFFAVDEAP
ncbi:alpha/beta hydrolase family protein [Singulisphaera sp. Ch08]|uniref:Alpha/beta hydrolase family protein n=1 Tax=Singulisphaera sp. Ch08 TaxID=3120278 RepID=A0AAU7CF58_9BACT